MEHYSNTKYKDGLSVLDLKEKGLSRVPDVVTELSEIEKLVLEKNNLIELPPSINKLKNLIVLNLENNKLTELWPQGAVGAVGELQPVGWFAYQYTQANQAWMAEVEWK